MVWLLCRAVLRCQRRRAGSALRTAPLAGALLLVVAAVAPFALARASTALGATLRPALGDPAVTRALVLAPMLAGAAAGAALCNASTGRRALGTQLAAGPVGPRAALAACVLAPAAAVAVVGLPAVSALAVPVGLASPGGAVAGLALVGVGLGAAGIGAIFAEALAQLVGGAGRGLAALVLLGIVWGAVGALAGTLALGPFTLAADALAGTARPEMAFAAVVLTAGAAALLWLELAARRVDRRSRSRRLSRSYVAGPLAVALPLAGAAVLGRRRELQVGLAAAVGFGLGGVGLSRWLAAPAPAPLQLGTTSALLGVALVPLAVGGALLAGRWAWGCAPRRRLLLSACVCAVATGMLVATAGGVAAVAAVVSGAPIRAVAELGLVALLVSAAATVAGATVPWRGATMGDQIASFCAFAVCAGSLSAAAGLVGPRLVAYGLPDAAAAACLLGTMTALGVGAVTLRLASA